MKNIKKEIKILQRIFDREKEIKSDFEEKNIILVILSVSLGTTVSEVISYTDIFLPTTKYSIIDIFLDSFFIIISLIFLLFVGFMFLEIIKGLCKITYLGWGEIAKKIDDKLKSW